MASEIDLNRLEIFKTVAHMGSFTKAAAQLKQPKSRVSRNIAALEKELGVQLIYRTTRQFQLTDAGQRLFNKAFPLLSELKNTLDIVSENSNEIRGPIRLTVPEDVGTELIGPILYEFMQTYPQVEITLFSSNDYEDLVSSSFDMALRIGNVSDSTMIQKKIGRVGLNLYAHPDVLSEVNLEKMDSLEKLPYLAFVPKGQNYKKVKVYKGNRQKTLNLKSKFVSNNFFILRSLAMQGMGVTVLPSFLTKEAVKSGRLVPVFKDWQSLPAELQVLIPWQKEVPLRIQKLMGFLAHRLGAFL